MGFDIFIQCCRNGERALFKRELVEEGAFDEEGEPPTVVADAKALEALIFGSD
jgi:hypothetical protein